MYFSHAARYFSPPFSKQTRQTPSWKWKTEFITRADLVIFCCRCCFENSSLGLDLHQALFPNTVSSSLCSILKFCSLVPKMAGASFLYSDHLLNSPVSSVIFFASYVCFEKRRYYDFRRPPNYSRIRFWDSKIKLKSPSEWAILIFRLGSWSWLKKKFFYQPARSARRTSNAQHTSDEAIFFRPTKKRLAIRSTTECFIRSYSSRQPMSHFH